MIQADDRTGADLPYFNDWASHPARDPYWLDIDGRGRPRKLSAPVHLMAGWFDPFLPGQINDFINIRNGADPRVADESRLVIGPWAHAFSVNLPDGPKPENFRKVSLLPSMGWFDRYLSGKPASANGAPVRLYVMGDNVWRDEYEWPLARTRYTPFFLKSLGHANSVFGDGWLDLNALRSVG